MEVEERKKNGPLPSSAVLWEKRELFLYLCIPQQDVSMEFSLEIERWQCNLRKRVLESILKD